MTDRPYADKAHGYVQAGWSAVPLPPGKKSPPPTRWTGYAAPCVSGADVQAWIDEGRGTGNIGLRTPEEVLGLDVDAYGDKPGAVTLQAAEERLGALPETVRSSARSEDAVSGIRFYQVPAGRRWADALGPGVEVVHHGHRYAVAAPSMHPEGGRYEWWNPDGTSHAGIPAVAGLPPLNRPGESGDSLV